MNKLNLVTAAIVASFSTGTTFVNAQDFTRVDESVLTPTEVSERAQGKGPKASHMEYQVNEYQNDSSLAPISAYVSNWGQYGREVNIAKFANGYDKLVLSFFGMCGSEIGDPANTSAIESLARICAALDAPDYEVVTTDAWGDMATTVNGALSAQDQASAGNPHWETEPVLAQRWYQGQDHVAGLLGAAKKAKEANPDMELAFSIGGWSLSEPFSDMAKDPKYRKIFVDSTVQIFRNFPMFSQVDIDWEYPGGGGAEGNTEHDTDGDNYALLISELRAGLDNIGRSDVKIAIAAGAPQSKLDASNLKGLMDAGLDIIHLMTYDFFGTPWAEGLNHHTNLYPYGDAEWSTDTSVRYMINELGIPAKAIHIGYATYSRNAANAEITNESPLNGTYAMPNGGNLVGGSWEAGVTEWQDFLVNFASIDASTGIEMDKYPGYRMLTDKEANADYFYNDDKKFFISMDTPRTAFLKAQYVKELGLGGLFTWMADYDNGLMLNAAREGMGYKQTDNASNIDMENIIYSCGENVETKQECIDLTNLDDKVIAETKAEAGSDIVTELVAGTSVQLDGSDSTSASGDLTYKWTKGKVTGIDRTLVKLRRGKTAKPEIVVTDITSAERAVTIEPRLVVTDEKGNTSFDTVKVTLAGENAAPIADARGKRNIVRGELLTLNGKKSTDPDGDTLKFQWKQLEGETLPLPNNGKRKVIKLETDALKNIDQKLVFSLTVSDGLAESTDTITINVSANAEDNVAPTGVIQVLGEKVIGKQVTLDGTKSTDDGVITDYRWTVSNPQGSAVVLEGAFSPTAQFVPKVEGSYNVSLVLMDDLGTSASTNQSFTVDAAPVMPEYPTYVPGNNYKPGDRVIASGTVYECEKYETWCSNAAYAPTGIYGDQAWITIGDSGNGDGGDTTPGAYPDFKVGTSYAAGEKVSHNNRNFSCKVSGWCSATQDQQWAYEPGVGLYWDQAWDEVD